MILLNISTKYVRLANWWISKAVSSSVKQKGNNPTQFTALLWSQIRLRHIHKHQGFQHQPIFQPAFSSIWDEASYCFTKASLPALSFQYYFLSFCPSVWHKIYTTGTSSPFWHSLRTPSSMPPRGSMADDAIPVRGDAGRPSQKTTAVA